MANSQEIEDWWTSFIGTRRAENSAPFHTVQDYSSPCQVEVFWIEEPLEGQLIFVTRDSEREDKDHLVLQQVEQGNDDVQKITSATILENHHVTYAFEKLEEHGLLTVSKPEGTVERVIDGQKRVFQHPKQAELTEQGRQYLEREDLEDVEMYENLSHRELVEKTHELEKRVEELERKFEVFRDQVQKLI